MTDHPPGLTDLEQEALDVASATYQAVRHCEALDAQDHWQRFANRLRSAAYAQTAPAYLEQVAKRFGVAHTPGDALTALLHRSPDHARRLMRTIRRDANALSVLVRDRRNQERTARRAA